ncbi:hypothetical protein [Streptomyces sp. NPDC057636]|uniref:hypothetical protein n=1 Tax=Streptomyces sp. NPDC057636 TaxID=3346189 RepID=UPI0036AE219A
MSSPTSAAIYRMRLRTFFKFVRNVFDHNCVETTRPQALAMITHVSGILEDVDVAIGQQSAGLTDPNGGPNP